MSRRHKAEKREIFPDPKYRDEVISKFMNNLMVDGKKSVAEKIVYGAFDNIESKLKTDPVKVFHDAIDNVNINAYKYFILSISKSLLFVIKLLTLTFNTPITKFTREYSHKWDDLHSCETL